MYIKVYISMGFDSLTHIFTHFYTHLTHNIAPPQIGTISITPKGKDFLVLLLGKNKAQEKEGTCPKFIPSRYEITGRAKLKSGSLRSQSPPPNCHAM